LAAALKPTRAAIPFSFQQVRCIKPAFIPVIALLIISPTHIGIAPVRKAANRAVTVW
jgi:hypothetical protein